MRIWRCRVGGHSEVSIRKKVGWGFFLLTRKKTHMILLWLIFMHSVNLVCLHALSFTPFLLLFFNYSVYLFYFLSLKPCFYLNTSKLHSWNILCQLRFVFPVLDLLVSLCVCALLYHVFLVIQCTQCKYLLLLQIKAKLK